jgi:HEAT repeat protein
VFQELRDPRAMRPLSELAFDTSGDVRVISMRVLETYRRTPGFAEAARVVRAQLDSTNRTRQLYAARAVGTLRDIEAIPKLIDLLSSRDRFVQEAALESLCSITGQQLGLKPHRWKAWYADNEARHRVEWIIDSLKHRDVPVRRWAADELTRITGHRVPFSATGDKRARELAIEAWSDWWTQRGRTQLDA